MANNRMYLVNRKTGAKIYLAKYYPSTGWYGAEDLGKRMNETFDESDFGHLAPDVRAAQKAQESFGPPYANYDPEYLFFGDQWELEYEITSPVKGKIPATVRPEEV